MRVLLIAPPEVQALVRPAADDLLLEVETATKEDAVSRLQSSPFSLVIISKFDCPLSDAWLMNQFIHDCSEALGARCRQDGRVGPVVLVLVNYYLYATNVSYTRKDGYVPMRDYLLTEKAEERAQQIADRLRIWKMAEEHLHASVACAAHQEGVTMTLKRVTECRKSGTRQYWMVEAQGPEDEKPTHYRFEELTLLSGLFSQLQSHAAAHPLA